MLRSKRMRGVRNVCWLNGPAGAILMLAVTIGGCSADLGRFDFPSAGFAPDGAGSTSAIPTPSEPVRRSGGLSPDDRYTYDRPSPGGRTEAPRGDSVYGSVTSGEADQRASPQSYNTGRGNVPQGDRMAALPPPQREHGTNAYGASPPLRQQPQQTYVPASARPATAPVKAVPVTAGAAPGNSIEVQPGDTLSSIAKQHRVSISELMSVNNLASPILRPGQRISLPAGKRPIAQRLPPAASPEPAQQQPLVMETRQPQPQPMQAQPAGASDWQGTHTIGQGESLYGIARKHNVKVAELQRVNGIAEVTKIRPGTVIKVPGSGAAKLPTTGRTADTGAAGGVALGSPSPVTLRPRIINSGDAGAAPEAKRVASLGSAQTATDAEAGAAPRSEASGAGEAHKASAAAKFRWPVKGKVISGFGPRPDKSPQ